MTSDEARLVRRASGGDSEAFAELVRRYRDAVYGYCYHRMGSFEDARDLAQDAFVRAFTCLDQLRDPERFGGWVRRIAANLCTRWAESRREIAVESIECQDEVPESPHAAERRPLEPVVSCCCGLVVGITFSTISQSYLGFFALTSYLTFAMKVY